MKKNLFFVGAICIAVASFGIFTAFAEPTEQEKYEKAYNALKDAFMKEQADACLQTAEAKAMEKVEAEAAAAASAEEPGKTTTTGGTARTTTKPTTGGSEQTTTTTTTTTTTATPTKDPKKDKMTDSKTTTTEEKKDKMTNSKTTGTDAKKDKMGGK